MIAGATPGADSLSEGMCGRFRIGPKRRRLVAGDVLGTGRLATQLSDVLDRLGGQKGGAVRRAVPRASKPGFGLTREGARSVGLRGLAGARVVEFELVEVGGGPVAVEVDGGLDAVVGR